MGFSATRACRPACFALAIVLLSTTPPAAAQEAEPPPPLVTLEVTGQVLDADGQPVAGADVILRHYAGREAPGIVEGASGPDGRFVIRCEVTDRSGLIYVAARKPGFALEWAQPLAGDDIVLRLGSGPVALSGAVTDLDGRPLAGARVCATSVVRPDAVGGEDAPRSLPLGDDSPVDAQTDEQGRFAIPGLPPDASVWLLVLADGYERWRPTEQALPAKTSDLRVALGPEAAITGRVLRDGQPAPGIRVVCCLDKFQVAEARSDDAGLFRLDKLFPGAYTAYARLPRTATRVSTTAGPFTLGHGQQAQDVELQLLEGGLIKGSVLDAATKRPVPGTLLNAYGTLRTFIGQPDGDGAFAMRVEPGTYRVVCSALPGGPLGPCDFEPKERTVTVADGETVEAVDFLARARVGHAVRGRAVDPEGNPVAGAMVGSVVGVAGSRKTFDSHFPVATDADGRFELPVTQPPDNGRWPVLALHRERNLAGVVWLPKGEASETEIEVQLRPGGCVKGSVVDTDGKPLASIPLYWALMGREGLGWGVEASETDEKGEFAWGPLPAGMRLEVCPSGDFRHLGAHVHRWGTMSAGIDLELEPIVLNPTGRTLRGTVLDADQRPVASATVYVSGKEEGVRTDADGRWELTRLPQQGKLWIVAVHPTDRLVCAESLDPDWEVEPGLMLLPPAAATGRLLDEAGNPVAGVKLCGGPQFPIEVAEGGGLDSYNWQRELMRRLGHPGGWVYLRTDADGRWRAEGLIPAVQYVFSAQLPERKDARVRCDFTVGPEDTTDVGDLTIPAPAP